MSNINTNNSTNTVTSLFYSDRMVSFAIDSAYCHSNEVCSNDPCYSRLIDKKDPSSYVLWDLNEGVKKLKAFVVKIDITKEEDKTAFGIEMKKVYNVVEASINKFLPNHASHAEDFKNRIDNLLVDPIQCYNTLKSQVEKLLKNDQDNDDPTRSLGDPDYGHGTSWY